MKECNSIKSDSQFGFSANLSDKIRLPGGFTLLELIITIAILGIIAGVSVPLFSTWLPDYRLKSAAMELFLNIKLAKAMAIKSNCRYRVVFDIGATGSYSIQGMDGKKERVVDFSRYDPGGNIGYGCGKAFKNATVTGGPLPPDFISYVSNSATFNPRHMGSAGYVYLTNSKGTAYAVGTWLSGNAVIKKWNEENGSWE
ncbi:MAG: prepilin-type N-terminal cleavage/methylation domain-containing protein [Deltaproteobacteria bacterium]|nr:prepilin-type N-terminal cleavage/methylation domain-containing protein [Deltaproteobacteria bacterium]